MSSRKYNLKLPLIALFPLLLTLGCEAVNQSIPRPRDFSQKDSDKVGSALATRPTGRDVDREGLQLSRQIVSLSDYAIRVYEDPDGQFVVDEKHTLPDGKAVVEYLSGQAPKHLRHGVVYFISQAKIANEPGFVAIKSFCIQHDVDLYLADTTDVRNIWAQGRPDLLGGASAGEVAWIIQARP